MKKLLFAAILMLGFTAGAFAQATATASATATATIVAPLTITKTVDMNFGNVAVGGSLGTVIMDPAGSRSATGGVTLPATAGTVTAASFNVAGQGTYTYAITLPSSDLTITSGANTMTVNTFTSTPSGTGQLTAGAQTLTVGATLNVDASQTAGTYISGTPFDVMVVYN